MLVNLFQLFLSTLLIDNVVLAHFFGFCPLLGVSNKRDSAFAMGLAVIFVIVGASIITYGLYYGILVPLNLEFLELVTFILVIASFVQFTEMFLKKNIPALYKTLGIYLPLITTNCAVLYATMLNITNGYNFIETVINSLGISVGFLIVIYLFSEIRERLQRSNTLRALKGNPIGIITAGLMALAFSGLAGLV